MEHAPEATSEQYLAANPHRVLPIARRLARRLRNISEYLIQPARQYRDHVDCVSMVEVELETLTHEHSGGLIRPSKQLVKPWPVPSTAGIHSASDTSQPGTPATCTTGCG